MPELCKPRGYSTRKSNLTVNGHFCLYSRACIAYIARGLNPKCPKLAALFGSQFWELEGAAWGQPPAPTPRGRRHRLRDTRRGSDPSSF